MVRGTIAEFPDDSPSDNLLPAFASLFDLNVPVVEPQLLVQVLDPVVVSKLVPEEQTPVLTLVARDELLTAELLVAA